MKLLLPRNLQEADNLEEIIINEENIKVVNMPANDHIKDDKFGEYLYILKNEGGLPLPYLYFKAENISFPVSTGYLINEFDKDNSISHKIQEY